MIFLDLRHYVNYMLYIHGIFIIKEKQKRQIDTDRKQPTA